MNNGLYSERRVEIQSDLMLKVGQSTIRVTNMSSSAEREGFLHATYSNKELPASYGYET